MNIKNLIFTAMIALSATNGLLPNAANEQQEIQHVNAQPQWQDFCKSYATTLIAGTLIGATTGKLAYHAIDIIAKASLKNNCEAIGAITCIATFIAEMNLRAKLVNDVNQSFEEHSIKNKKLLTADIAWIASWIAFLASASSDIQ